MRVTPYLVNSGKLGGKRKRQQYYDVLRNLVVTSPATNAALVDDISAKIK